MIKTKTAIAPSISETFVLLLTQAFAWQLCNARVRAPVTIIKTTTARYVILIID